ncbi:MAG: hypothetical protein ACK4NY_13030 [Spirosomataceae bacterium]
MRKLILLLLTLLSNQLIAQRGITFIHQSFTEALKLAKQQKKIVFVAYTNYGGNSRWMEMNVLNDPEVGETFNENFINLKINGESLRDKSTFEDFKYRGITAGYFFFTPKGELIHKFNFTKTPSEILNEANVAINLNNEFSTIEKLDKAFKNGERSQEFLYLYSLRRLQNVEVGNSKEKNIKDLDKAIRNYVTELSDVSKKSEKNMILICEYLYQTNKNCSDALFQTLMNNIEAAQAFSDDNLAGFRLRINRIIDRSFNEAVLTKNEVLLNDAVRAIAKNWNEKESVFYNKSLVMSSYRIDYYEIAKDWTKYKFEINEYLNHFDSLDIEALVNESMAEYKKYEDKLNFSEEEWKQLRDEIETSYNDEVAYQLRLYGWRYAQNINDKESLKEPLKWLSKSLRLSSNPIALKTYSNLLYKTGREQEAKRFAEMANKLPSSFVPVQFAKKVEENN